MELWEILIPIEVGLLAFTNLLVAFTVMRNTTYLRKLPLMTVIGVKEVNIDGTVRIVRYTDPEHPAGIDD